MSPLAERSSENWKVGKTVRRFRLLYHFFPPQVFKFIDHLFFLAFPYFKLKMDSITGTVDSMLLHVMMK